MIDVVNNKYNMILYDLLNEAGILTADIDRAARKELLKVFPETIKLAVRSVSINLPKSAMLDTSELYDRVYNYFILNKVQLINYICNAASIAFTDVPKIDSINCLLHQKTKLILSEFLSRIAIVALIPIKNTAAIIHKTAIFSRYL